MTRMRRVIVANETMVKDLRVYMLATMAKRPPRKSKYADVLCRVEGQGGGKADERRKKVGIRTRSEGEDP